MKYILSFLLCCTALAQQTVNNFAVKTNLFLRGENVSDELNALRQNTSLEKAVSASGGSSFIAVGDSHTAGGYANLHPWTDANKILFADLRWPNIVASKLGLGLTNRALSGTTLNDLNTSDTTRTNSLQQLSILPFDFSGLVTVAHGYNDSVLQIFGDPREVQQKFYRADCAVIGRVFAESYTNPQGKYRDGTTNVSFSTTGTVVDEGRVGMGMFPVTDPSLATRIRLDLLPGQVITFTATNPFVWFQPNDIGNSIAIYQGTNIVDMALGYNKGFTSSSRLFSCLDGRGLSGTFTVTNISGTNMVLAVGSIQTPESASGKVFAAISPNRLAAVLRGGETGVYVSEGIRQAAAAWSDYPVFLCDWANAVDTATVPVNDPDHPNPAGQRQMANAVLNARRITGDTFHRQGTLGGTLKAFQVLGNFSSGSQFYPSNGVTVFHLNGEGYVDSSQPTAGTLLPLNIRTSKTKMVGGLVTDEYLALQGAAALDEIPIGNQILGQMISSKAYVDFMNWNGTNSTVLPGEIRSSLVDFSSGSVLTRRGFSVRGAFVNTADIPVSDQIALQFTGGKSFIDSFNWNGTNSTFLPLDIRASITDFPQGPVTVARPVSSRGTWLTTAQIPTGNQVAIQSVGGIGYLQSFNWASPTLTLLPLNIQSTTTTISTNLTVPGTVTAGTIVLGTVAIITGSGAPSAAVPNGSLYLRTDGIGPNLYVRENGVWVAK